ncbi:DUF2147 domain-containing protein [bacterium SCSIO 12741]|nr:DUF2147 domain-containing protein [bacterium SCSIO 12741]
MNTTIYRITKQTGLLLVLLFGLTSFASITAQNKADEIIGTWELEDKTSKMEIYKKDGKYYGKLLYGKDVVNEDGSSKKDIENPDESLRNRDIIGSTYIHNLTYDGDEYDDGKVYDSTTGKTWSCYVEMEDGDLHFTGYMGAKWLGQTYVYKRVK